MADHNRREPDLVGQTRAARDLVSWLTAQGETDEELAETTVLGQCELAEACSIVLAQVDDFEALIAGCNLAIDRLQARRLRLREGIARRKAALAHAIEDAGLKRLPLPEALLSLTTIKPGMLVTDEARVPDRFWREEAVVVRKLDRGALTEAVGDGERIEGAEKTNGGTSLAIRRR